MSAWNIPTIDIGPARDAHDSGPAEVAAQVGWACENIGFLMIGNHGVPADLIARAFDVSLEFFRLPTAEKNRYRPEDSLVPRGYQAFATRNLGKTFGLDTPPDLREQFFIGPLAPDAARFAATPEAAPFYAGNIWPQVPGVFEPTFRELYCAYEHLASELMRIFAIALGLRPNYFADKIDHHFNTCPTNYYPPVDNPEPGQLRAGQHTDFGSLTILAFNDAPGGLQVLMPDGDWLDVRPRPGNLVVNIGDMMARWTNDRWKSTLHRVVNPPSEAPAQSDRQSIGYFLHPNFDTEVACLETCQDADHPPRYAPIRAGDHMREKLRRRVEG